MKKSLAWVFAFILITGCTSLGPKYEERPKPKNGSALLTIYRPYLFAGAAGSPYICLDNKVIGEFVNGSYFQIEISPGKHKLESKNSFGEHRGLVDLELKSNQEYYARFDIMGLPGSAESSQAGAAGTGAVNPIAGSISSALLRQTSEETKTIMKFADERIPQTIKNLGLLMVKSSFAKDELTETKLYNPPSYSKNHCELEKTTKK